MNRRSRVLKCFLPRSQYFTPISSTGRRCTRRASLTTLWRAAELGETRSCDHRVRSLPLSACSATMRFPM
jgi:hypothetical protein